MLHFFAQSFTRTFFAILLTVTLLPAQNAKLKEIKPGWNLFSKDQDIQMGKEYSQQIEQQVEVLPPGPLTSYINELGQKIATQSPANAFQFQFKVVNDPTINAFALPGGFVYINTGILLNANNEAEVVGVIAHECSHVALRHSTNSITKSYALQIPAMALGMYAQSRGGITGMLGQLGVGLAANGALMSFSRAHEQQADLLGARMMHQAGYNPIEMANFFEVLEQKMGKSGKGAQFFSSHPNPGNRVKYVSEEATLLPRRDYTTGTGKFEQMKTLAKALPAPKAKPQAAPGANAPQGPTNSDGTRSYTGDKFKVSFPGDWTAYGAANAPSVTIAPQSGVKQGANGQAAIGLGVIIAHYEDDDGKLDHKSDTEKLVDQIMQQNPSMGKTRPAVNQNQINGRQVYVARLTSQSPLDNSTEVDTIVTMIHQNRLIYCVFIAPEKQLPNLQSTFEQILGSLTLQ